MTADPKETTVPQPARWKPENATLVAEFPPLPPHAAYIAAVANALEAAGVPVGYISAPDRDLLEGFISPAPPVGCDPDRQFEGELGKLLFVWHAEAGWGWGRYDDQGTGVIAFPHALGGQVVPPRDVIAAEMATVARGTAPPPASPYRSLLTDDFLDAQLAAYAAGFAAGDQQ